ncbi:NAD(P)-dependent oxidoreductase [Roseibacillus ishigakijimensis]|uniref:NAD(P)-dependent oxidoreductase n=1 Tax=Roseibacillus ishigakijimensis TaxID=454146 RepID=A0A934RPG1_9BACT|nr:NAD(P)-dependent oxidoreductase [Roseibacillus ishigakijimensis]
MIEHFEAQGCEIMNFDCAPPQKSEQKKYWREGSIMEGSALAGALADFGPEVMIHLAARTDCVEDTTVEEGYEVNTVGVRKVCEAIKKTPSLQRVIMTSTQYVSGPGRLPEHDEDYFPHTVYGQSKVEGEKIVRAAELPMSWCFIRPVNIWGPYHARYGREFWRIAAKGLYLHPGVPSPTRAYGYIGNVVWQIDQILQAKEETIQGQAIYVGDPAIPIDRWSKGFVREFRGKDPLELPYPVLQLIARVGDLISSVQGKPFYLTSSRLNSMTEDYLAPVEKTYELFGPPPYTLEEGIGETAEWYRREHA